METCKKALYERFRDKLDFDHLENLRATLLRLLAEHGLPEGKLVAVKVGPPMEAVIFVLLHRQTLWLLAGHWVRAGEPNQTLLAQVERYRREILGLDNRK